MSHFSAVEPQVIFQPVRSDGSLVYNMADYQSGDYKIDPLFSGLSDETTNQGPVSGDLVAGVTLNKSSLSHSIPMYSKHTILVHTKISLRFWY